MIGLLAIDTAAETVGVAVAVDGLPADDMTTLVQLR